MGTDRRVGLLALAAAGATLALAAIALVVFLVRWLTRDEHEAAAQGPSVGAVVATDGMRAPGTAQLRRIGCDPAIVIDVQRLLGESGVVKQGEPRYVVTCDVADGGAPTCEQASAIYFAALGGNADGNVNVRVSRRGSNRPACSRMYAPNGADLGELPPFD